MTQDPETNKPKNYPGFRKNLSRYFSEYSDYTGIHGLRFIGQTERSYLERFVWFVLLIISLYFCIDMIVQTYEKWQMSPVIVSFAKDTTPIWKIPFPAVTICPETKTKQRAYNFTHTYHKMRENRDNMTDEEIKRFEQVSLVCDKELATKGDKTIGYDTVDYLSEVAPKFSDVLWQCKWLNENETCDALYTPMLTEEGVCFTFNMLDREEMFTNIVFHNGEYLRHGIKSMNWTIEKGYPPGAELNTFPRRAIAAGQRACLSMLMTLYEQDLDYLCRGAVQGFKISLHDPSEMPSVSQNYFRAALDQEVVVAITPKMMTTSEGLMEYSPQKRQCYFQHERSLRYFQMYTQRNCELECLTNWTLKSCGCVGFHMPHDESTNLCGPGSVKCMGQAHYDMISWEVEKSIESFEDDSQKNKKGSQKQRRCDCLPSCTSLTYNAELSQADFNWASVFQAFKVNFSEFPGVKMTRVTFFFKEQQFITSERNELYGLTDFVANCGGLLGLFIGFSFLSLIEIIYFLSLRLFCNLRKFGCHFWSGSPELLQEYDTKHED